MVKATVGQSTETLAQSLEERCALEVELNQICNIAQVVVSEGFGSGPSTSTPVVQLAEIPDEVWALISDDIFYGTSRVLTSMVTHYPDLDIAAIYRGYVDRWSTDKIHALGESLVPHA